MFVLDVDPATHRIAADTADGVTVVSGGTFAHSAVPWLRFDIDALFGGLEISR